MTSGDIELLIVCFFFFGGGGGDVHLLSFRRDYQKFSSFITYIFAWKFVAVVVFCNCILGFTILL
jgi:hypothetical protein